MEWRTNTSFLNIRAGFFIADWEVAEDFVSNHVKIVKYNGDVNETNLFL
jgi:hypothetical protein